MPGKPSSSSLRVSDIVSGVNRVVGTKQYEASTFDTEPELATNRGHKLKRKAEFVHEGRLTGKRPYKRTIEHAGYTRNIVFPNPPRYDEDGLELDSDEGDKQADADAIESNPYSGVEIQDLLMPLTSVSGLWRHPAMSHAYTNEAISGMVIKTREMLRKERNTLALIKGLTTKLRGDHCRVASSMFLADEDVDLYSADEILKGLPEISPTPASMSKTPEAAIEVNVVAADEAITNGAKEEGTQAEDVDMAEGDAEPPATTTGVAEAMSSAAEGEAANVEGTNAGSLAQKSERYDGDATNAPDDGQEQNGHTNDRTDEQPGDDNDAGQDSPAPRMMTRGAAAAANGTTGGDHELQKARSPSPQTSLPAIHPAFLPPRSSIPDRDLGLPPWEAEETRKLANVFIQKQEEVVRGVEKLHDGFLAAERMRQKVYHWSRADEHTGTLSDGEDWVDEEQWGLTEPLKKGATEGEEEGREEERKGKGRRRVAAA